ncbi:MAG: FAD-binding protein [Sulfolobales archaeon]|nr:FAD-binding protein [Sulfolobales archaeon]MCX8186121.1 FAD-binding protein [Sulfolobales archaeon]MDW7969416.1 FAD-binding protein [Sulfolobales archaeon]
MNTTKMLSTDLVVIGGGIAGLSTIYFIDLLSKYKNDVKAIIISKSSLGFGSSTYYSAGAFRCPVSGYSKEEYVRDVIEGGRYINRTALVRLLADYAFNSITALEGVGLRFKASRGTLRVISEDPLFPGKEIVLALRRYVLNRRNTTILDNTHVLDIVRVSDSTFYTVGITYGGEYVTINSKAVCLATGGISNIFIRSDNPQQLTCDGHGICLRLGLPLVDMEFTQFFPLGIAEKSKPSFMIPFQQGRLVNKLGEELISKYGLESLGKAIIYYRDALSRSMMFEVAAGNDVEGSLLLYPEDQQDSLSSFAHELMRRLKLTVPVKVLPTAHFSMGGVEVDHNINTSVNGLYIAGELVGGVHGANRLGGNALTSCVVTSMKAAENILKYLNNEFHDKVSRSEDSAVVDVTRKYVLREGKYSPESLKLEIRHIMWADVGVLRSEESIKRALNRLNEMYEHLDNIAINNWTEVIKYSELENTLLASIAVSTSALLRTESRGSHFRTDHPEESSGWKKSIKLMYDGGKFKPTIIDVT